MSHSRLRWAGLASLLVLATILIGWPIQRMDSGGVWLGMIWATPLLLPAWGLVRENRRAVQGGILLQSLYLLVGLTELTANPAARYWALAALLASLAVCGTLLVILRLPENQP